jgi:outer membrane protein TolC
VGLPNEYLDLDPSKIPVDLDQPTPRAKDECAKLTTAKSNVKSLASDLREASAQSLEANAAHLKARAGMDVVLTGKYGTNGIDVNSRSETWKTVSKRNYPAWAVELSAEIPLGASEFDADALSTSTDAVRARAAADQESNQQQINAVNRCTELEQKERAYGRSKEIFEYQSERLRLQQQRFKIGRTNLTEVVIASDDRVAAERGLQQTEVERRLAAWKVLAIEGGLLEAGQGTAKP